MLTAAGVVGLWLCRGCLVGMGVRGGGGGDGGLVDVPFTLHPHLMEEREWAWSHLRSSQLKSSHISTMISIKRLKIDMKCSSSSKRFRYLTIFCSGVDGHQGDEGHRTPLVLHRDSNTLISRSIIQSGIGVVVNTGTVRFGGGDGSQRVVTVYR